MHTRLCVRSCLSEKRQYAQEAFLPALKALILLLLKLPSEFPCHQPILTCSELFWLILRSICILHSAIACSLQKVKDYFHCFITCRSHCCLQKAVQASLKSLCHSLSFLYTDFISKKFQSKISVLRHRVEGFKPGYVHFKIIICFEW